MVAPVTVALVGIGGYGRTLLDILLREQEGGKAALKAVVVIDPKADREPMDIVASRSPKTKIFPDWSRLMESARGFELIVLPVGIPAHRRLAVSALEAGCDVLVEKPLAGSIEDGQSIVEASRRSGKFAAVGFQNMYEPLVHEMKGAILRGRIGRIRRVKVFGIWGRSAGYYLRNNWAGKFFSDGEAVFDSPFNNGLAHFLNMALFLAGNGSLRSASPVSAKAALFRAHDIETCDTATVHWQTQEDVEVAVYFSHLTSTQTGPRVVVQGTQGDIHWEMGSPWELCEAGRPPARQSVDSPTFAREEMIRRVLRRVRDPSVPVFTAEQAVPHVRAVALAHASTDILNIPESAVQRKLVQGSGSAGIFLEVPTLETALREAFCHDRLLRRDDLQLHQPVTTSGRTTALCSPHEG